MNNGIPSLDLSLPAPAAQDSVDSAWRYSLRAVSEAGNWIESVKDKLSIGSQFGTSTRPFRELTGFSFKIVNPRKRVVLSNSRKLNFPFLFANFVWTLSGSDKLEMIAHYNARGICFSDDGVTLASAFGPKVFGSGISQFEQVSRLLSEDPSTRRAVIGLFDQPTLLRGSRDVSCALSMQFLNRNGRLDCIVHMRSQSALMVMPYDLFLFTMIHECMAARTDLPLGHYTHICGSIHYYQDEEALVTEALLETPPTMIEPMPEMTDFSEDIIVRVKNTESALRSAMLVPTGFDQRDLGRFIGVSGLPLYWQFLFKAFFGERLRQMDLSAAICDWPISSNTHALGRVII